jgi:hypothetical protein
VDHITTTVLGLSFRGTGLIVEDQISGTCVTYIYPLALTLENRNAIMSHLEDRLDRSNV